MTPTPYRFWWARRKFLASVLGALTLVGTACGTGRDGTPSTSTQTGVFPVTVKAANGDVRIDQRPERIVSLSPTGTEMLFAVGAKDQVVAVDESSDYPPEVPKTDLSGLQPNVEAIAKFNPDLVITSDDPNNLVKSLDALDIPVMRQPPARTLDDTYQQITQLGVATGHSTEAANLVADMKSRIERLVKLAPKFSEPPTYYHELDATGYTVTSRTFIGEIYRLVGLKNIADAATGTGSEYPQLAAEFVLKADPDLIFLADTKCCGQSAKTVAKRPGWKEITAVKTGAVVELDDSMASRWGPRVTDFLDVVVQALAKLESAKS